MARGGNVFKKYLCNDEANKEAFVPGDDGKDGELGMWFRTGDVACLYPDGHIRIFDRIKNLFKLQQGEYVAPEKVEGVLSLCTLLSQVFVTGNSEQPFCVAICVPDILKLKLKYKDHKATTLKEFLEDENVCKEIFDDLRAKLKESKLNTFEKPQRIYLSDNEMSVEDDCLTPTLKVRRNFAVRK